MNDRVTGGEQLRALAARLRAAGDPGKGLRKRMRRNIVAAVKPMQADVKRKALAIPTRGSKHTGLRAAIAKATKIRVRASGAATLVRLEVAEGSMPAGKAGLPGLMDGKRRPWRHPVHGTNTWVTQDAHPFFDAPVRAHIVGVRAGVEAAVKETAAAIENEKGNIL